MADPPSDDARWVRIKTLFAGALEQRPEAVSAWLRDQCADDGALCAEVEALLASHHAAGGFLDRPAIDAPGAARVVADRVGPNIQRAMVGRRVGPYRIVGELARGGMGVVYLAERDDEVFRKRVAIKVVQGGVLQPSLVARFEGERRILATLEHPNIARLLDAGADEGGMPFAVMEYVEGTPIDVYARERGLSIARRLELFCVVCDAVQYSHQRLVVHRDIKAGNVLVTADGVPKLLDFGIAKLLGPPDAEVERTRTEFRALTPESASPEQVRGDPITVATDVYSLGALLFRLLTGTSPYRRTPHTDVEIARAICDEPTPRPSDVVGAGGAGLAPREAAALKRELRGDLDLITIKAMRKEPERRYASVERLAADVRRHLRGEPVEAAPDSRRYRMGKFLRRHRAALAVAAVIAVTVAAGVVGTLLEARAARIERGRAERRFNDVRGLARSMIFELHDAIEPLPGATAARELLIRRALQYLDRLASEGDPDPSLQRELAEAYTRIGEVQGNASHANLGQTRAALDSYLKALAIRARMARAAPSDASAQEQLAGMHRLVAMVLSEVGDTRSALEHLRAAVSIDERLVAAHPRDASLAGALARSYQAQGDVVVRLEDWPQLLALREKALPLFRRAADAAPGDGRAQRALAIAYKRLGAIHAKLGHYPQGLEAYRSALAIDEKRLASAPDNPEARMDVTYDVSDIGYILLGQGDRKRALAQYERARAIREDLVRGDPKDARAKVSLANTLSRIGGIRWELGDRAGSLDDHRAALALLDALAAAMPADASVRHTLAEELYAIGLGYEQLDAARPAAARCDRARPFLARALDTFGSLAAKNPLPPETAATVANLRAAIARCEAGR